jgi:putative transposase
MGSARVRLEQVALLEARGQSRRRAGALLSVARSSVGYTSRRVARDAAALTDMRTLAGQYPRFGYRRIR